MRGALLGVHLVPPALLLMLLQLAGGAPLGQGLYPMPASVLQGQWGTGTGSSLREGLAADGAAVGARTPRFTLRKWGRANRMPGSLAKPSSPWGMPTLPGLAGKRCPWHLGTPGFQGVVCSCPTAASSPSCLSTCASPGGPSALAWPAGGWLWVGTGGDRYGHTWGCTRRSCTGLHTHGHMQGHADTGTQVCAHGAGTGVHRGTRTQTHMGTPAGAHTPLHAHVCAHRVSSYNGHTQTRANTLYPCANPIREVTLMPVTLGNANRPCQASYPLWPYRGTGTGGLGAPCGHGGVSGGGTGGLSTLHVPGSAIEPGDAGAGGGTEERAAGTGAGAGRAAAAAGRLRALCPLPLPALRQPHPPLPT